ncbi:glycoside hydrolase family 127 protein [Bifidobacterium pullorum]|uniref:glycoside hydrolase family 127 protein n=1 Tax=Bifidobacterium pullorum TaxID=78448 RepID=UPI00068F177E|nr:beta-L-arabinofuranosidase domain-containing protein [Bifidobacterium pullorum]
MGATTAFPGAAGTEARLPDVEITSAFWTRYINLVIDKVLPYQWAVLNGEQEVDLPPDPGGNPVDSYDKLNHSIRNLKVAAGEQDAPFHGMPFQDSDVYKWLEAVAYALHHRDDPQLRRLADDVVDLIARAQREDGYLDTFFQIQWKDRVFKRIQQSHELYSMGHYIEAAVAYWQATGNEKALEIAKRMAACIEANFGDGETQVHGADGHPEIELALARLAEATGEERYAMMGRWFLNIRGQDPDFYDNQNRADGWDRDFFSMIRDFPRTYYQAAEPIADQRDAQGHAVRVAYLCTGLAHIARLTGDASLAESAERLWNSIVRRRMYITGQIGSTHVGESFTYDYDLPNDTMYGETCASVGMSFFARQMLALRAKGEYGDVLEKELFNGALAGMSLDGTHFYYVNPLEADPAASAGTPDKGHVLTHRAGWFACACCPSNLARLITSIDRYIYTVMADGTILAHQFIASKATFANGVRIEQTGDYPWDGEISWSVSNPNETPVRFGVRVPAWSAGQYTLTVEGEQVTDGVEDGFVYIEVPAGADRFAVVLGLNMGVRLVRASNRVREDAGKVAVMRGPLVYCAEECDNEGPLWLYSISGATPTEAGYRYDPDLLGGVGVVTKAAVRAQEDPCDGPLYLSAEERGISELAELRMVPYYTWANRADGQMTVWLNRS